MHESTDNRNPAQGKGQGPAPPKHKHAGWERCFAFTGLGAALQHHLSTHFSVPHTTPLVRGSLTFLTASHAQLAAIGALVAFHASDTGLAGAQSSHLLTVITH